MTQNYGYTKGLELVVLGSLNWADAAGWKCMLLSGSYVFDPAHDFVDDVNAFEVAGTAYVAGGQDLTGMSISYVDPRWVFDCDDPTWAVSTITARYAVFYFDTGTPATSPLMLVVDAEGDVSSVGTAFSVPVDSNGLFRLGFA